MEFIEGGELFDMISKRRKIPEDEARYLFR